MKRIIFTLIIISWISIISAQEVTTNSCFAPIASNFQTNKSIDTIKLPLFSDFSEKNPLKYYEDNYISIATFQAVLPPSVYAAMFDATDNNGDFYASNYSQATTADFLTSKPIDLLYATNDSIYFSFFYEPKGILDTPEENDSLVLQFYAPNQDKWENIWFATNYSVAEFQLVKFKITDTAFLQKGFKYRFYNKISMPPNTHPSLVSNCDYWFVDYIYLNKGRSFTDNSKRDISFQYPAILKIDDYNTVPYTHYKNVANSVNHNIRLNFRNNDNNIREVDSMYIVFKDKDHNLQNDTLYIGSYALVANNNSSLFKENISFQYPITNNDILNLELNTTLTTDTYDSTSNNIVVQTKKLGTVYSYDDQTSENGYGLYGDGTQFSYVAQQYVSYKEDDITGMRVFFNRTFQFQQPNYFYAVVWDNQNGTPYSIIYEQAGFEIDHNNLNNFQTFEFDEPVSLSDTFYIGWMKTTENLMNVGLDLNYSGPNKKFYSIYNGIWSTSSYDGAIMMQPIFGDVNQANINNVNQSNLSISMYPNPVNDFLNIQINEKNNHTENFFIYDISGRLLLSNSFNDYTNIDLSNFSKGFYIIEIKSGDKTFSGKIIKQ